MAYLPSPLTEEESLNIPPPPPPCPNISDIMSSPKPSFSPVSTYSFASLPIKSPEIEETMKVSDIIPSPEAEVRELCRRLLWQLNSDVTLISCYQQVRPILQDGPKCGLVALSMAGECLGHPLSVDHIFMQAQGKGYTLQGEMFSAVDMATLCQTLLPGEVLLEDSGFQNVKHITKEVATGHPLLVPYDADFNHEPCCKRGHKAHWAVVTGLLLAVPCQDVATPPPALQDSELNCLFHVKPGELVTEYLDAILTKAEVYFFARQGKSRHLGLWKLEELQQSNENLVDMDPKRKVDAASYVVPTGGLKEGLCNKLLILKSSRTH